MSTSRCYTLTLCLLAAFFTLSCVAFADDSTSSGSSNDDSLSKALDKVCDSLGPKEAYLSKQLTEKPDDLTIRLQYADLLLDKNKLPEALEQYEKVNAADKANVGGLIGAAACYARQGKSRLALDRCSAACAHDPSNVDAVSAYLGCAHKFKVTGEALPAVRRLQDIDKTKAAKAFNNVAKWVVATDYWTAQKFAKAAHDLDPKTFPHDYVRNKPLFLRDKSGKWLSPPPSGKWETRFGFGQKVPETTAPKNGEQQGSNSSLIDSLSK